MVLTESETEFLDRFENKEYAPELLFQQVNIVQRIAEHPMALLINRYSRWDGHLTVGVFSLASKQVCIFRIIVCQALV